MYQPLEVPFDEDGFVTSFTAEHEEEARNFFEKFGFVVLSDVLSDEEISDTLDVIFGENSELDKDDISTWEAFFAKQRFAFAGIIGSGSTLSISELENRQHPKVHRAFATILGTERLVVDHDRLGAMRPTILPDGTEKPEWRTKARWLHLDCNPVRGKASIGSFSDDGSLIDFDQTLIIQGLITLTDARVEDGGFHCVPGSHKFSTEWARRRDKEQIGQRDMQVNANVDPEIHAMIQKIPIRRGCLLLWTSLLFHGNHPNHSDQWRCVQYIRMLPHMGTPYSALPLQEFFPPAFKPSQLGRRLFGIEKWPQ